MVVVRLGASARQRPNLCSAFIWRRTAKACPHRYCRPTVSTFILPRAVFDARQRAFALRATKSARQCDFTVQNSVVCPVEKRTTKTLSCVFVPLSCARGARQTPVSCSICSTLGTEAIRYSSPFGAPACHLRSVALSPISFYFLSHARNRSWVMTTQPTINSQIQLPPSTRRRPSPPHRRRAPPPRLTPPRSKVSAGATDASPPLASSPRVDSSPPQS
jgi:hypothetical protein